MNELIYNFLNQIEDPNVIKEMTVDEFVKLVKTNNLISNEEAEMLIESFKKIASKKDETSESDSEQRKKKYRDSNKQINQGVEQKVEKLSQEKDDKTIERD